MTPRPPRFSERRLALRRRLASWFVSDRAYVAHHYRKAFGRAPDLEHPSGFNEKIRNIRRAVFAEELLPGDGGQAPTDYKLFVFGGKVRLIQVDLDRFGRHTQALFDERWRRIDGTVKGAPGSSAAAPPSLAAMVAAAEALSLDVDFVRVDLYDIAGNAVLRRAHALSEQGPKPLRPAVARSPVRRIPSPRRLQQRFAARVVRPGK